MRRLLYLTLLLPTLAVAQPQPQPPTDPALLQSVISGLRQQRDRANDEAAGAEAMRAQAQSRAEKAEAEVARLKAELEALKKPTEAPKQD